MANEKEEPKRLTPKLDGTIKVRVNGPGSIIYGASLLAAPDEVVMLTEAEFKSVKDQVTRLDKNEQK